MLKSARYPIVLASAMLCLFVTLQVGRPFYLAIGSGEDRYIKGWQVDDELVKEGGTLRYFRWTLDGASLRLPIVAHGSGLAIRIHALRHGPGLVKIVANFEEVFCRDFSEPIPWQDYEMSLSRNAAQLGPLTMVFLVSSSNAQPLALAVDWVEVKRGEGGWIAPSRDLFLAYLVLILLLMIVADRLIRGRAADVAIILGIAVCSVGLFFWKIQTFTIIYRMWPFVLILLVMSFVLPVLKKERGWGVVFAVGMMTHGVIYFHPYLYPPDLHYHFHFAQKLQAMTLTDIYKASVMYDIPGDFSLNYPYSPVFHLLTGSLSPAGADVKYVEKLLVLTAFGLTGLCLIPISKRLGFGPLPLALFFLDPTILRHLYRCHMPGMFGICLTAGFILFISVYHVHEISRWRAIVMAIFLAFAMCTYPASFLQLSIFMALMVLLTWFDPGLRRETPRFLLVLVIAFVLAMLLFYGHYVGLIIKFFFKSRLQVVAMGRSATLPGVFAIWWQMISREKAWPFYIPAIVGAVLMGRRVIERRWRAIQLAWSLTFLALMILTCDYLLPSIRGHIKEMAFLTPLLLLYESECFIRIWRSGRMWRVLAVLGFLFLACLSMIKMLELIRLGFAMP